MTKVNRPFADKLLFITATQRRATAKRNNWLHDRWQNENKHYTSPKCVHKVDTEWFRKKLTSV